MSLGAFLAGALLRFLNFIHFPSNQTRCKVGNILNIQTDKVAAWDLKRPINSHRNVQRSNEWIWLMNLKANKIQSIILRSRGIKEGGARITHRGSCIPKVFRQDEKEWLLYPCTHGRRCFTTSKLHCFLSISRHFTKETVPPTLEESRDIRHVPLVRRNGNSNVESFDNVSSDKVS